MLKRELKRAYRATYQSTNRMCQIGHTCGRIACRSCEQAVDGDLLVTSGVRDVDLLAHGRPILVARHNVMCEEQLVLHDRGKSGLLKHEIRLPRRYCQSRMTFLPA